MSTRLFLFSVFDAKAGAFLPPFFLPAEPVALRTFGGCCSDPGHSFGQFPGDYTLFRLGTFDVASAAIVLLPSPEVVATGVEARERVRHDAEKAEQMALRLRDAGGDPRAHVGVKVSK